MPNPPVPPAPRDASAPTSAPTSAPAAAPAAAIAAVAVVQFNPIRGAVAANLVRLAELAERALAAGVRLVVLPEMAATGYRFPGPDAVRPLAEPVAGRTFAALAPLARRHAATLVAGFVETAGGRLYNSALAVGPDGRLAAHYRKRLLYVDDTSWASPGDLPYPVFDTPCGRATLGICMDINGAEFVNWLHSGAATLACFPTNWVHQEQVDVHAYWRGRLAGWPGALLAADRWGEEDGVRFAGRAAVLGAGAVLASAGATGDGWLAARVPGPAAALGERPKEVR
ncbi:MAG: carbon-nitrogen hydrolase family protein [Planctomycetes bacterium]|nr:carbon-nitrogen hydrolase family protein [Planctomycetota bacterium]